MTRSITAIVFSLFLSCWPYQHRSLSRSSDSIITNNAEKLFHLALLFREFTGLPNTVIGVQSILFLVQFATLNPSSLDAWYLIGVGMRTCVRPRLHQTRIHNPPYLRAC